MPDRPIVLSTDEVRETLAGRMGHILRPMVPQPTTENTDGLLWEHRGRLVLLGRGPVNAWSPYGHQHDRLWVRETWGVGSRPDPFTGCRDGVEYRADEGLLQEGEALPLRSVEPPTGVDLDGIRPGWHSSTSMPRWASRLSLDVVAVRVQRLQEVTEEQSQAVGIPLHIDATLLRWEPETQGRLWHGRTRLVNYYARRLTPTVEHHFEARRALADWWRETWDANPWIWDITVKRVEG